MKISATANPELQQLERYIHVYSHNWRWASKRLIMRKLLILMLAFYPITGIAGLFGPSNFWECVLAEMPGVKNDPAAYEVLRYCQANYPEKKVAKKQGSLFGPSSAGECVLEYGADVTSPKGAKYVRGACYQLYPR